MGGERVRSRLTRDRIIPLAGDTGRRRGPVRRALSRFVGVPLAAFLRGFALNRIVAYLPLSSLRYAYYRNVCGMRIGASSSLWLGAQFTGEALGEIRIGEHCSIGYDSFWVAGAPIVLEDNVVTGHRVEFYTSDHDPDDPAFGRRDAPIRVEEYAWIGSRAVILKGVTLRRGAVVAAGSIVTRDVEPFTIVAGNPARPVRRRRATEFTFKVGGTPPFA